MAESSRS